MSDKIGVDDKQIQIKELTSNTVNNESELFPEETDWNWNQLPVSESVLELLKYRWIEAKKVFDSECYLSVVFLCGSLLEGVLRGAAEENPEIFNKCNKAPKHTLKDKVKVKTFREWNLNELIDVAFDIGLIDLDVKEHSHTLRDFRNYIHPYQQLESNFKPDKYTAKLCFTVLTAAFASLCGERSTNLKRKPDNGITLKKPYQVPSLPRFCVKRSIHHEKIKEKLLNQHSEEGTLLITSIFGLGGIGKSTLAAAIAHEEDVKTYFSDGILWATLGKEPDCLQLLNSWIQALGDYNYKPLKEEDAKRHLQTLLNNKKILIVVDDAWKSEHVEYFQVGGNNCRVIVTTREVFISGANRYELGVMTESESLELLKSHLQTDLKPSEQDLPKQLAKKVGYLPLALELVACQIANDSNWQELLDYLTEEIARLEYLDIENSTSDEEKRKKYSLEACFNLSLKSLTQEELKQFIWFGILPEDVVITHKMAATLWGVNPEKANQILKRIASKSLLQRGKIEFKEKPTYRIHDLLHDLATKLITAEKNPKQPEKLPGLGLNIIDAHRELLKRYEEKIDSGKWHTLPEDGYINAHLTWHFQKANQNTDIHKLLQEETPDGNNGWYETCNRTGKIAIFINDVRRAWGLAEESWNKTNPSEVVGWQCRYALIITSMNSLVANLPAKLLIALVRENIWTPEQTLSHILQSSDPKVKAHLLISLVDYLPNDLQESVLPETLSIARQIRDEYGRAEALTALADKLPSVLPEALSSAKQIRNEKYRAQALIDLSDKLPAELLSEALSIARQIHDEKYRAQALIGLVDKLPPELLPEVLSIARQIQDEYVRAKALIGLADKLPSVLPEALSTATQIQDEKYRAEALIGLADKLPPELLPEALSIARQIHDEKYRAQALIALADKLPSVLPEALSTARQIRDEYGRAEALIGLADKLPPELLPKALSTARQIRNEYVRAKALIGLADKLPSVLPEALSSATQMGLSGKLPSGLDELFRAEALIGLADKLPSLLPEALSSATQIWFEWQRAEALIALIGLADKLPPELLPKALSIATQIQDEKYRTIALTHLVDKLPPELLPEALSSARQIHDEKYRAQALTALADKLPPELLPEALSIATQIQDEYGRTQALIGLANKLPSVLPEALSSATQIQDEYSRTIALTHLADKLPPELLPEALSAARQIQNEYSRAKALIGLANKLPSVLPEALSSARQIQGECDRTIALTALADKLPPELLPEALSSARQIQGEYNRTIALTALADKLPSVLPEALSSARQIPFCEDDLAYALTALVDKLPVELLPEALSIAKQIQDEKYRAEALIGLSRKLPSVLPEALSTAKQIQDEKYRAEALIGLSRKLPVELLPEALSITRQIQDEYSRTIALTALADKLPSVLPEALSSARQIPFCEDDLAYALTALVDKLPVELLPEALSIAKQIQDEKYRAEALIGLSRKLPSVLPEALSTAKQIQDEKYRAEALIGLSRKLPSVLPEALSTAKQIQDEYSRTIALIGLSGKLPSVLPEALSTAKQIQDEEYRTKALTALADKLSQIPPSQLFLLWKDSLAITSTRTRQDLLQDIGALVPVIFALGNEESIASVACAIKDVARWWP